MAHDSQQVIDIEGRLEHLAESALEASTAEYRGRRLRQLIELAETSVDIISEFEDTHDPRVVARSILYYVTLDPRYSPFELPTHNIDLSHPLSQRLVIRRANYFEASTELERRLADRWEAAETA